MQSDFEMDGLSSKYGPEFERLVQLEMEKMMAQVYQDAQSDRVHGDVLAIGNKLKQDKVSKVKNFGDNLDYLEIRRDVDYNREIRKSQVGNFNSKIPNNDLRFGSSLAAINSTPSPTKPARFQLVNDMYGANNIFGSETNNSQNWKPSQPEPQNMREKNFRDNQKVALARQIEEDRILKERAKKAEKDREEAEDARIARDRKELTLEGKDNVEFYKTKYENKKRESLNNKIDDNLRFEGQRNDQLRFDEGVNNAQQKRSPAKPARIQLVNDLYSANNIFNQDHQNDNQIGNSQNWKPSQPEPQNMREKNFRDNQKVALARQIEEDRILKERAKKAEKDREEAEDARIAREREELVLQGQGKYDHYLKHGKELHGSPNAAEAGSNEFRRGEVPPQKDHSFIQQKRSPTKASRIQLVNDMYSANNIFSDESTSNLPRNGNGENWKPSQPEPQNMREKNFRDNQKVALARQIEEDRILKERAKKAEKDREEAEDARIAREREELVLQGQGKYDHYLKHDKKKHISNSDVKGVFPSTTSPSTSYQSVGEKSHVSNKPNIKSDHSKFTEVDCEYDSDRNNQYSSPIGSKFRELRKLYSIDESYDESVREEAKFALESKVKVDADRQNVIDDVQLRGSLPSFSKFIPTQDESGYYVKTPPNLNYLQDDSISSYKQRITNHKSIDNYGESSMASMEYLKSSDHARHALSSPDSFLNHFQNKYSFEKGGLSSGPLRSELQPKYRSSNNSQSTINFDDHSSGIRTESKFVPENVTANNLFGESSFLEQSLYSESILDYNFTLSTEFSGSMNRQLNNVSNSAEKAKQRVNMFDSNLKPSTPTVIKPSNSVSKPTTPNLTKLSGNSKPATPNTVRPIGSYQSPNIVLTSAGKCHVGICDCLFYFCVIMLYVCMYVCIFIFSW